MFRKLRNKLIWINLGITTIVIVTAFTMIYVFYVNSAHSRPPHVEVTVGNERLEFDNSDFATMIDSSIASERQAAAQDLLIMLIVSGVAIEIIVAMLSYFLAEEAIKPVREAYTAQKVFIANASHEIKTPLAAIAANLEAADISGNRWIDNIARETEKLTELNGELLTLARTDLTSKTEDREINLNQLITDEIACFQPRLDGIILKKNLNASSKTRINADDFSQIFRILLDNAIKYCDKRITITIDNQALVIKNDGAKISTKDLPHVFERFYQTDKSAEGVGLGLSIAKALAERNDWGLSVKSDKTTRFTLSF